MPGRGAPGVTRRVLVTISHLEMTDRARLRPSHDAPPGITLRRESGPDAAEVMLSCYRRVGAPWHWYDRANWTVTEWAALLATEGVELWTARAGESLVGFFLLLTRESEREVQYFGLVPEWIGRRVGGWLLTEALRRAWATDPARVVLNTCSLDGPAALPNYLARGFTVEREEQQWRTLPS